MSPGTGTDCGLQLQGCHVGISLHQKGAAEPEPPGCWGVWRGSRRCPTAWRGSKGSPGKCLPVWDRGLRTASACMLSSLPRPCLCPLLAAPAGTAMSLQHAQHGHRERSHQPPRNPNPPTAETQLVPLNAGWQPRFLAGGSPRARTQLWQCPALRPGRTELSPHEHRHEPLVVTRPWWVHWVIRMCDVSAAWCLAQKRAPTRLPSSLQLPNLCLSLPALLAASCSRRVTTAPSEHMGT